MVYAAITWSTCLLPRCSHRVAAQGAVQPPGWLPCMLQVHSHAAEAVPVAAATESPTTLSTAPAAVFACAVPLAVLVGFGLGANVSGCAGRRWGRQARCLQRQAAVGGGTCC